MHILEQYVKCAQTALEMCCWPPGKQRWPSASTPPVHSRIHIACRHVADMDRRSHVGHMRLGVALANRRTTRRLGYGKEKWFATFRSAMRLTICDPMPSEWRPRKCAPASVCSPAKPETA
jgi:hypothetical protein